jgi:hypothetical protein
MNEGKFSCVENYKKIMNFKTIFKKVGFEYATLLSVVILLMTIHYNITKFHEF